MNKYNDSDKASNVFSNYKLISETSKWMQLQSFVYREVRIKMFAYSDPYHALNDVKVISI